MTITLKRLARSDIELLRTLRNANSSAFFTQRYVTKADQEDWWYKLQQVPFATQFYSIWLNRTTPVGFLSVKDVDLEFVSIGGTPNVMLGVREIGNLLLDPAYRGQGIMAQALTEVRRLYDPMTFWIAHVKPNNTASLRLFERAGFWAVEPPKGKTKMPHPTEELDPDIYKLYAPEGIYSPGITWEQAMLAQIMRHLKTLIEYEEGKH